jgi:predicted HTH transcriptional regulator
MRPKDQRGAAVENLEPLSQIISELNDRFGLNLGPEHRVTLQQIQNALEDDAGLEASARENARLTFDDKPITHAALKTIAAFLNTDGGDLLLGVAGDGTVLGIELDHLESDDKVMRHLIQVIQNGLGDRAGTCVDPKTQIVDGKTVCLVSCQRSPEPVFLEWKGLEVTAEGDFFVSSTLR